jgi:hypothetical protein
MEIDWGAPAAWANRSSQFRALLDRGRGFVEMELVPRSLDAGWSRLRDRWISLPRHGNLLDAIEPIDVDDPAGRIGVVLRYAALDWWKPVLDLDSKYALATASSFGAQLAEVFQIVLEHVEGTDRALFLQPFAHIDLDLQLRVGFESGASMRPPELALDERAFVFVVGRLWTSMLETVPHDGVGKIIRRCIDISPRARFSTLEKLRLACLDLSAPHGLRSGDRLSDWYLVEEAIGWRERGDRESAFHRFKEAMRSKHYYDLAWWGMTDTCAPRFIGPLSPPPAQVVNKPEKPPARMYSQDPTPPPVLPRPITPARASSSRATCASRVRHDSPRQRHLGD